LKAQKKSVRNRIAKAAQAKEEKKKKRTRAWLTAAGIVAAAALVVFVIWYGSQPDLVKLTAKDGKYVDKSNGIAYVPADVNYEPEAVGEPYADADGMTLYTVRGLDPKQWLTEKYEGVGAIYYADTIELPGLDGWQANAVLVCESDVITVQKAEVTDADEVAAIVAAATQNPLDSAPEGTETGTGGYKVYHLKFTSAVYSGLYYDLLYLDNGANAYFYNRSSKLYYDAGSLLVNYLPRTAASQ
jgi:hypothetical protein